MWVNCIFSIKEIQVFHHEEHEDMEMVVVNPTRSSRTIADVSSRGGAGRDVWLENLPKNDLPLIFLFFVDLEYSLTYFGYEPFNFISNSIYSAFPCNFPIRGVP